MKFTALIFDFNGLIVDDESIHCELFQKILMEEDITLSDSNYWDDYLGFDDKGLLEAVFQKSGKKITPKKLKDLILKKNELYFPTLKQKLRFFPGVIEFIHDMKNKFPLAIVSGALRSEIEFVLKESNILDVFELIVSADDTKRGKPDPEGFVLAYSRLKKNHPQIIPDTCLVLEDSLAGIESAHRAGMKVAALTHTYPREKLKDADWVVDGFEELSGIFKV